MKQLILCLALIGMSGSVFAQVSTCEQLEIDDPCICDFAQHLETMYYATYLYTETYHERQGAYFVDVAFLCPDTPDPHEGFVSIGFWGQKEKYCQVTTTDVYNSCSGTYEGNEEGPYGGKQVSELKKLLNDILESL